jgi:hypothetical protein
VKKYVLCNEWGFLRGFALGLRALGLCRCTGGGALAFLRSAVRTHGGSVTVAIAGSQWEARWSFLLFL